MSSPANSTCVVDHERIDYISNLPDTILCEILSYLPTKAVVKSSILSRKWKYIWTQVPALDFADMPDPLSGPFLNDQQIICLKNFVDRVLLLNNASYIQRFCFRYDFDQDPISIKSWFDAVKWRELCEVNIELRWKELVSLPREFLCGSKLVALNLNGFRINDMPTSFYLPNLQTAHFGWRIAFPSDQFLKRFLLGSPVLKELLIHSTVGFDETICVESLSLKSLEIKVTPQRRRNAICINIAAPNLWYLCLHNGPANYNIGDLNMLGEADLCLRGGSKCRRSIDDNIFQLLKKVSMVKTLRFGISPILLYQGKLPTFENLTHLKLENDQCTSELLKYVPNLKSLIFEKVGHIAPVFYPEAAHECMSCLERVEFFLVDVSVLNFIEHFFRAATALKEMIFNLRGLVSTGRLGAVRERLMSLPIASPCCQIKFVY